MPESTTTVQPLCDVKSGEQRTTCNKPALYAYTWEWGESGTCCAEHQVVLQQTAGNLGRTITFVPLNPGASPPMQREERVRLTAERLAVEAELEEAKGRGLDLYRENTKLTQQVQALTVRSRETEAQLRDLSIEAEKLRTKLHERDAELGELVAENDRLKTLARFVDAEPRPGGETTTVVD